MTESFAVPRIPAFDGIAGRVQVVFHGINKSGSLAMTAAMRDAYADAGRSHEFFSHYFINGPLENYLAAVAALPGHAFIGAHYLYGKLPPVPDRVLVTQFRHPLPRLLSCYNWIKRRHAVTGRPVTTLEEWVERTRGKAHSQIIQFGCGYGRFALSRKGMSPQHIFETCVDAIEREVFCFGIAEYFEESIFQFASLCGLPAVRAWVRDERNPGRPLSTEIPDSTREMIEDYFRYDYALYDYALAAFRKRIEGIDFGPELQRYKAACAGQYRDRLVS